MQKHNHIKAILFLGIFSLMLLHQALPHLHHLHSVEHLHKAIAKSEVGSDHHNVPKKENSKKGLLDLFLEVHTHSIVTNEIIVTHESDYKQLNTKKKKNTVISVNQYSISINYDDETKELTGYHPPNNYFNTYLSSLTTRGPPIC